jgi:hypothetical protein
MRKPPQAGGRKELINQMAAQGWRLMNVKVSMSFKRK